MESVRSKKVRSRRTPVANLASFAPRERLSANRDRRGAAASRTPPISAVRVRLTQPHLFRTAAPGHRVALPAPVGRPLGYPRPGKHTGAHPSARGKGPSSTPVSAPHVGTPLFASILPTSPKRRPSHRCPRHVPTRRPALRLEGRARALRLRQPPPPLALIELQSHPRRSDEIAIQTSPASPKRFRNSHFTPSKKESTA